MRRIRVSAAAVVTVLASCPGSTAAQEHGWAVSSDISTAWFGAGAEDQAAGISIGPGSGTAFGIGLTNHAGAIRLGFRFFRMESGLRLAGEGVTLTADDDGFTLYEVAPEAGVRLLRLGAAGAGIHLVAGPTFDLWQWEGADDRTRIGGRALLGLQSPIAGTWTLGAWLEGAVSGSVFDDDELPSEYERPSMVRGRVGVELRYGL